ncbi:type II secretion system F family protein [Candidatus Micrarchaeota archaeon]|nr:type II secretion system F family protein [Candidatus Micrarchaeota archaeon]
MNTLMGFYETIGRLLSRKKIKAIERALSGAGVTIPAESFVGFFLIVGALASLFVFLIFLHISAVPRFIYALSPGMMLPDFALIILSLIAAIVVTFGATFLAFWAVILLQTEARKSAVEEVLPDFLTLMAANIRSGMTIDQAMWYAAKPEYGLFSIEVRRVVKNAFSGEAIEKSLDRLDMRFNSRVLHRTLLLLKQALATGGETAEILEETAQDARDVAMHKKDIASTLLVYIIFLVFASAVGAPFLFSVSKTLIAVLASAFAYMPAGGLDSSAGVFTSFLITPSAPSVSTDEFFWFSMALVFVTSLIGSLLLGIVQAGSKTQGIKFFPLMLGASYAVYFLVSSALESMFASMFF